MLTDGLESLLAGESTISSIVGTPVTRRDKTTGIFLQQIPKEAAMPVIAFEQTEGLPIADSHDGPDPLHEAHIAFTPQCQTARQAKVLQITLRRFLEGYQGLLSDGTELSSVMLASEFDAFEYAPSIFQAPISFRILYRDTGSL